MNASPRPRPGRRDEHEQAPCGFASATLQSGGENAGLASGVTQALGQPCRHPLNSGVNHFSDRSAHSANQGHPRLLMRSQGPLAPRGRGQRITGEVQHVYRANARDDRGAAANTTIGTLAGSPAAAVASASGVRPPITRPTLSRTRQLLRRRLVVLPPPGIIPQLTSTGCRQPRRHAAPIRTHRGVDLRAGGWTCRSSAAPAAIRERLLSENRQGKPCHDRQQPRTTRPPPAPSPF